MALIPIEEPTTTITKPKSTLPGIQPMPGLEMGTISDPAPTQPGTLPNFGTEPSQIGDLPSIGGWTPDRIATAPTGFTVPTTRPTTEPVAPPPPAPVPSPTGFQPVDVGSTYTPPPPPPAPTAPPPPTGFYPIDDGVTPPASITPPQVGPGGGSSPLTAALPHPESNPTGETPVSMPGLPASPAPTPTPTLTDTARVPTTDTSGLTQRLADLRATTQDGGATGLPGGVPGMPGVTLSPMDPANDLRFQTVTGGNDPRLAGTQGLVDVARDSITGGPSRADLTTDATQRFSDLFGTGQVDYRPVGTDVAGERIDPNVAFQGRDTNVAGGTVDPNVAYRGLDPTVAAGASVNPTESARLAALGTQQDTALSALTGGPNRTALAAQTFADLLRQGEDDRRMGIQNIGRSAASLGRIGAGLTTSNLSDLETEIQRRHGEAARGLARDVSEGDINDRFRTIDTISGLRGREYGLDAATRGEQRGERDYTTGLAERNTAREFDERGFEAGLEADNIARQFADRDYSTGLGERNLERGLDQDALSMGLAERNIARAQEERDAATGLSERNLARATDERGFEAGLAGDNADRAFDRTRTAAGMGMEEADLGISDRFRNLDALSGLEDQQFAQGATGRAELRGEREYQSDQAEAARQAELQRIMMEDALIGTDFDRNLARLQAGFEDDPSLLQANIAGSYGADADALAQQQEAWAAEDAYRRSQGLPPLPRPIATTSDPYAGRV